MLVLQQMSVPLAQFYVDTIFQADIDTYFTVVLTFLMLVIQFIGFFGLYLRMIDDLIGCCAESWEEIVNLPTAASSLVEIYSYTHRHWVCVELLYDVLNSVFTNIASRASPHAYWLNILLHAFDTYLHATQKPSMYAVHNWLDTAVGGHTCLATLLSWSQCTAAVRL
jgi:hypothetical protein